jgi:hypothetical protein
MLFRETVAVYYENHTEHTDTLPNNIQKFSSYLIENTLLLRYNAEPVNAVYCENCTEHKIFIHCVGIMQSCLMLNQTVR